MGDRLLVAVGQRLTACTRATDTVARLGGDEFAVLLDAQSSLADSEAVADRLAQAFDSPFSIDGHELRVGGSIGRAVFPIDADNAEELLRVADAAMYDCKRVRKQSRSHAGRR
jgi:diguanylate cyclase (GGDEF)-like protein